MNNPFQELADKLASIEQMLVELQKSVLLTPLPAEPELLDVPQAAQLLRLTTQTVYDKIHAGTLPYFKKGNRIYFFKHDLLDWLKTGRQKTAEELAQATKETVGVSAARRQRKGGSKPVG